MISVIQIFFPRIAHGATPPIPAEVTTFMAKVSEYILNPLILLMFAVATLYFIYGVVQYVWQPDNEEAREVGRRSMIWGIVGMFVMISVFGIMRFLISSIDADSSLMDYV